MSGESTSGRRADEMFKKVAVVDVGWQKPKRLVEGREGGGWCGRVSRYILGSSVAASKGASVDSFPLFVLGKRRGEEETGIENVSRG